MALVVGIDTALVNTGLVVIDHESGAFVWAGKPFPKKAFKGDEDSFFHHFDRIRATADWIWAMIIKHYAQSPNIMVAIEDYLLTGKQRAYKTAELNAVIKDRMFASKLPYCLVHPGKTKKYVNNGETSKTEMIAYCKAHDPKVLENIEPADHGDIADAWAIAQLGRLVFIACAQPDPIAFVKASSWEKRWKEVILGDSGILGKPGLVKWSYQ